MGQRFGGEDYEMRNRNLAVGGIAFNAKEYLAGSSLKNGHLVNSISRILSGSI